MITLLFVFTEFSGDFLDVPHKTLDRVVNLWRSGGY